MNDTVTVLSSAHGYAETVQRLKAAIGASGATIFAEIDQATAAQGAGLTLRPTTLILFGNPKGGTPLMDRWPLSALALPLRVLIWEDSAVRVAFPKMEAALEVLGVPGGEPHAAAMATLLANLGATIAG